MPNFLEKRAGLGIHTKMVYTESARKLKLKIPLCEIRYVSDEYSIPISMAIYGDNINLLIYSESPIGIHIQNKEIARSFMNYFNPMWKMGKK
ncbi:Uncharacterised protein [uncultured archaeon]|nr:Uncharacterised protein [uncultured archaeon]